MVWHSLYFVGLEKLSTLLSVLVLLQCVEDTLKMVQDLTRTISHFENYSLL